MVSWVTSIASPARSTGCTRSTPGSTGSTGSTGRWPRRRRLRTSGDAWRRVAMWFGLARRVSWDHPLPMRRAHWSHLLGKKTNALEVVTVRQSQLSSFGILPPFWSQALPTYGVAKTMSVLVRSLCPCLAARIRLSQPKWFFKKIQNNFLRLPSLNQMH